MTNYLADYANFKNEYLMDEAAHLHLVANSNNLNDTDRAVFDMIRHDSMRYGAAQLKHHTIEKTIGKSNATVRRTIRKLERLGIIERIHFIRPIMSGLGANIYIIKPSSDQGE